MDIQFIPYELADAVIESRRDSNTRGGISYVELTTSRRTPTILGVVLGYKTGRTPLNLSLYLKQLNALYSLL